MSIKVYLAGPIAGLGDAEVNDWRRFAINKLSKAGIIGVSPLRCEPPEADGTYDNAAKFHEKQKQNLPWFRTSRAIAAKNWLDSFKADAIVAYMPDALVRNRPSFGTVIEIGWAIGMRKPLFLVSDHEPLIKHPLITETAAWIGTDLNTALDDLISVFEVYNG